MRNHPSCHLVLTAIMVLLIVLAAFSQGALAQQSFQQAGVSSQATLSFSPAVAYSSLGRISMFAAIADLNGDGKPDLIVTSLDAPLGVLLGNGDGTFQTAVDVGGSGASAVVVADVNGDGKPDLVSTSVGDLNGTVEVLLGNGDGTFRPATAFPSGGNYPASVVVADVNGDGKPDVVVANEENQVFGGVVDVLLGNGDGTFQPAVGYGSGAGDSWSVTVADVNGDSKPDLVVANVCFISFGCGAHGAVTVLLGNGDGTFQPALAFDSGGFQAFAVAVADVNGDGKPDVAVANVYSNNVGVLLGNGDGTFQPAVIYSTGGILGQGSQSIVFADVDGDGKPDLLVANCSPRAAYCSTLLGGLAGVLLGKGDGTFKSAITFGAGGFSTWAIAVGDANRDGKLDLVLANYCGDTSCVMGSVGVLLNTTPAPKFTTSTTLVSNLNPSTYGQAVTWTASVTSSGSVVPTGTVNFKWNYTIGSGMLNANGIATLTKSSLNADPYPLVAVYLGDASNSGSTSAVVNQVVLQTTSAATIASSLNPSKQGQTVTFTATITSPTVIPTGPVTFTAGKTVLGTAQLSAGKAKFATSTLAVGSTVITATYYGNSNIATSSASLTQTVNQK